MNGTARIRPARVHPIVGVLRAQGRSQAWLAKETGYDRFYVNHVFNGRHPAPARFRAVCAAKLGLDEAELFDQGDASATPRTGANHRGSSAGVAAGYAERPVLSMPEEAPSKSA